MRFMYMQHMHNMPKKPTTQIYASISQLIKNVLFKHNLVRNSVMLRFVLNVSNDAAAQWPSLSELHKNVPSKARGEIFE